MKGCRTVSVVEDAHRAGSTKHSSTASTPSALSGSRCSFQEGTSSPWVNGSSDRKRATSLESWLHNALHKSDVEKETRRAARRAKRKAFFRKLFFMPPAPENEEMTTVEPPVATPPPSTKAGVDPTDDVPNDEGSTYKLDAGYYASMASILNQYKTLSENGDDYDESETEKEDFDTSDLDSNTDMSEISVFDLEEDQTDDENDMIDTIDEREEDDYMLGPIPETELVEEGSRVSSYVIPPVRIPMEYTMQDRRGGTLVSGRHVLFTSAAFKRKQRQMIYHMRPIPEDAQYIVPQVRDDDDSDDELNTSGVYALQNEWI